MGRQGVQNLLDAIKKFENRRFLQISTDEVYGSVKFDSADENEKRTKKRALVEAVLKMLAVLSIGLFVSIYLL